MSTTSLDDLRARFEAAGQGHVLRHWDELHQSEQPRFLAELEAVDLALVGRLAGLLSGDASQGLLFVEFQRR